MPDRREAFPPANLTNWFQEPLRDNTDLDDKVSFELSVRPDLDPTVRTESTLVRE